MADDSNFQTFKLNLDIKDFTESALSAQGSIERIGNSENLTGLVEGLLTATAGIAALAVAAFALKTTFDLVFEGEQIQKTNNLFNELTKNIGVSADAMKNDLVKSAGGLASDTEIIQAANKAIVSMGDSAYRLPEVMDAARKITMAFGGDLIERFNQISFAVSSGSTRMLKHNGIMIDAQKAIKDYAQSLGVSADMLTEEGRRQAVLNSVLDYTKEKLGNVKEANDSATVTMKQLQIQVSELKEQFVVAFERTMGPAVRSFLANIKDLLVIFNLGKKIEEVQSPAEKAAASLDMVNTEISMMNRQIAEIENNSSLGAKFLNWLGLGEDRVNKLKQSISDLKEQQRSYEEYLASTNSGKEKEAEKDKARLQENAQAHAVDRQKRLEAEQKVHEEILKLKEQAAAQDVANAENEEELNKAQKERAVVMEEQHQERIAEIKRQRNEGKIVDQAQFYELLHQEDVKYENEKSAIEAKSYNEEIAMNNNRLKNAQTVGQGIAAEARKSAAEATKGMTNAAHLGMVAFDSFKKHGVSMFEQFGKAAIDHSMSASEIMKGFFLNSLADIAMAQGEVYLAQGLIGDPGALAAGAALIALSGALRALAGSAGGGGSIGDYGSGGGGGGAYAASDSSTQTQQPASPQKSVSLVVQGNYFETEQTKTRLLDMIRGATDATDFKYVQIGKT